MSVPFTTTAWPIQRRASQKGSEKRSQKGLQEGAFEKALRSRNTPFRRAQPFRMRPIPSRPKWLQKKLYRIQGKKQKHVNVNKFAGLSRDWVGSKKVVYVFLGHSICGRKTHKQIPQNPGTIPCNILCTFFFIICLSLPTNKSQWCCIVRFGCDSDTDLNRAMPMARETSKTQTLRNTGPFFFPHLVGSKESVLKVPKRGQFHAATRVTTKHCDLCAQGALGRRTVSRRNFCDAESLAKRCSETCH